MAQFHFGDDYEQQLAQLLAAMPLDEAMAAVVGGHYQEIGAIECDVLRWAGLTSGMQMVDLGCGTGRLACALGKAFEIEYFGIDVVQSMLDYAKSKSPSNYRFQLCRSLSLPVPDRFADFVTAFGVFTQLSPSETYLYLEEIKRALKPGGTLIFSFLEFGDPEHRSAFLAEVANRRVGGIGTHLNTLIEPSVIEKWCSEIGYRIDHFVDGTSAPWGGDPLCQAIAVLRRCV